MPSWLIDTFVAVNTLLLIINTILILFIWAHVGEEWRRQENREGGDERNWSWYEKHLTEKDRLKRR